MSRLGQWLAKIVRLPLRLLPRNAVVRIRSGTLRGWRWIAGSSTNGCWLGTYERNTQRLFREQVHPGAVVFDIGANVGFFTLLASKLVGPAGHVHAFEPLPRNLYYLEQHVRLNEASNITVQSLAITSTTGTARFGDGENTSQGRLSNAGEIQVLTASLDDLIANGRIPRPDFIKMDIEGAEGEALRGAARLLAGSPLIVVLSTHGYDQHELCWTILKNAGFKLDLLRDGTADGDYLILATK
ncbi:MAG TPA: FkbM family methyltransferase [Thermoanaerobaculia bacterium]|jgi:FkbM family methyltransferase|nr:FkbM family methyltransferase [Thermoanaerobaculia bacterium]